MKKLFNDKGWLKLKYINVMKYYADIKRWRSSLALSKHTHTHTYAKWSNMYYVKVSIELWNNVLLSFKKLGKQKFTPICLCLHKEKIHKKKKVVNIGWQENGGKRNGVGDFLIVLIYEQIVYYLFRKLIRSF